MPNWTQAQSAAIEISGADILVSAAAGSGKTAALTERILRHIKQGGSLDRFLIVTFSRASAADMKSKLTRELRRAAAEAPEDKSLERALTELSCAKIGTIHSFCLSVLKKNHAVLGLPAKLRVADDAEAKLLRSECISDAVDYFFSLPEELGADFVFLTDQLLGGESDETMEKILLSLYETTSCLPKRYNSILDSANELESAAENGGFLLTKCGAGITRRLSRELFHYEEVFSAALSEFSGYGELLEKYSPVFSDMLDFVRSCKRSLNEGDFSGLGQKLSGYSAERLKPVKGEKSPGTEYYKAKKTEFASFVKASASKYFSITESELSETLYKTARASRAIVSVLAEFDKRYAEEKRRLSILDYEDLEHMTLALLQNPETAARIASEYDEIYIDECQDINAVQNAIFEAIAVKNRFMVGDVKQSIYAFRGADPTLFDSYRKRYRKIISKDDPIDEGGAAVFMSDNFRCDMPVIEFTNAVCGAVMPYGNVSYTADDELRHGKTEPDGEPYKTKIIITDLAGTAAPTDSEDEDTVHDAAGPALDPEAVNIAAEVEELLRCGKRRDGENLRPSDIAILLRSAKGRAEKLEDALRARGIPVSNDTTPNFFESPEILLILSLLSAIDNPLRDIYLAGALRSPVFGFTLDDLVKLGGDRRPLYRSLTERAESDGDDPLHEKCRYAKKTLLRWRELARRAASYEVIDEIYRETGIEALLWSEVNRSTGTTPPEIRAANLAALAEYARNYERSSFRGLHRFLDYINSIIERDVKTSVEKPAAAENDAVTIMTMHQSKGLEFPVVILGYCGASRNTEDTKGSLLYDKNAGLALRLRYSDEDLPVVLDTLPRRAVSASVSDTLAAEEMRLLYVGLTRARERLIISAKMRDAEKSIEKRRLEAPFFSEHTVYGENSYIGWILSALFAKESRGEDISALCSITLKNGGDEVYITPKPETDAENITPDPLLKEEYKMILKERLSYLYPYKKIGSLPAKMAVSSLYPGVLDEDDDTVTLSEITNESCAPQSSEAELAAKRGTATHIFLQFCDFENTAKNGVDAEISRLLSMGFIRPEDAELIIRDEAAAFFRSDIYKKLAGARRVWREKRFNLRLPAHEFTEEEDSRELYLGEEILVQGVIDCFFEDANGNLILLDYKTDRLSDFEKRSKSAAAKKLLSRHSRQLGYYARALGDMFGRAPAQVFIYSLPLGDVIEVFTQ